MAWANGFISCEDRFPIISFYYFLLCFFFIHSSPPLWSGGGGECQCYNILVRSLQECGRASVVITSCPVIHSLGRFWLSICLRVSIAVQRHHDHSKSYKGKHLIMWLTDRRFSPLSSRWNMAVCRQTRCGRRNWEFYILICRQQEETWDSGTVGVAWVCMRS